MAVITLTTDWRGDDYYTGAVKGMILSHNPQARIIDITHKINPFNVAQAAFILRNSFIYYPKGSVHIIDVNAEATANHKHIAVFYKQHYFITADNGFFGLLMRDDEPEKVVTIDTIQTDKCRTFPALHIFAPAAAAICAGKTMESLGSELKEINRQIPIRPTIGEAVISGSIIYIDSYQNAITNISSDLFARIGKGRKFEILVQSLQHKITHINQTYGETLEGELLAVFNSAGLLEIAINRGNAAELLNLGINSGVRVKFLGE